jgi:hypothetical protein
LDLFTNTLIVNLKGLRSMSHRLSKYHPIPVVTHEIGWSWAIGVSIYTKIYFMVSNFLLLCMMVRINEKLGLAFLMKRMLTQGSINLIVRCSRWISTGELIDGLICNFYKLTFQFISTVWLTPRNKSSSCLFDGLILMVGFTVGFIGI